MNPFVNLCRITGKSLGILDLPAMTEAFNVSSRTIRRWVAKGQLPPPKRLGKNSYWRYEDISDLMIDRGHR